MMEYKGYVGAITYDPVADLFRGEIANLSEVVTFEGHSIGDLKHALAEAVDQYLAFCRERGEKPDRPFSGRMLVRMDPQTHRAVATAAAREGKSLNAWTVEVLERAAGRVIRSTPPVPAPPPAELPMAVAAGSGSPAGKEGRSGG